MMYILFYSNLLAKSQHAMGIYWYSLVKLFCVSWLNGTVNWTEKINIPDDVD